MGLYIPNRHKPNNCRECPYSVVNTWGDMWCNHLQDFVLEDKITENCNLMEVTEDEVNIGRMVIRKALEDTEHAIMYGKAPATRKGEP